MKPWIALSLIAFLLLQLPLVSLHAESADADAPEPYDRDEFPQWLHDLRRAEIVYIGSFPLSMLLTSLGYEAFRALKNALVSAPIEERSEFGSFTVEERRKLLISGLSVSGVVTLIDLVLELRERRIAEGNEQYGGTDQDRSDAASPDNR